MPTTASTDVRARYHVYMKRVNLYPAGRGPEERNRLSTIMYSRVELANGVERPLIKPDEC